MKILLSKPHEDAVNFQYCFCHSCLFYFNFRSVSFEHVCRAVISKSVRRETIKSINRTFRIAPGATENSNCDFLLTFPRLVLKLMYYKIAKESINHISV